MEATGASEASEGLEALEERSVELLVDVEAGVEVDTKVQVEHMAKDSMEDLVEDKSDPSRKLETYVNS